MNTRLFALPAASSALLAQGALLSLGSLLPIVAAPSVAQAQRIRPAFEPKLVRKMTVSGTVRLKIVPRKDGLPHEFAPIGRGGWAAVVRIDGHILASLTKLPATVNWDTRAAGDGVHEVLVSVRNARADQEVGVEGAQVIVDNATADTAAEAAELARTLRAAEQPSGDAGAPPLLPVLTIPEKAKATPLAARFSASRDPLATRVTTLLRSGSRLYLGLPDGGIAFCTPDNATPGGSVIRLPQPTGAVRSLVSGGGRVWWTTEDGRAVYAYNDTAHAVTRYDVTASLVPPLPPTPTPAVTETPTPETPATPEETGTTPTATPPILTTPPAKPPKPMGWVRRIAILRGAILLLGDAGIARALDPKTGALTDVNTIDNLLPEHALQGGDAEGASSRLYVSATDDANASALVVSVTPAPLPETPGEGDGATRLIAAKTTSGSPRWRRYLLKAWRSNGPNGAWKEVAAFATDADPERGARLALSPSTLATAEREGPRLLTPSDTDPRDLPYSLSPGMPSSTDRLTIGASGLWWEQRGIVFRADPQTGARDAYLPWNMTNEAGAVLALAADKDSVWIATTSGGVRRIRPGRPSARDGYNGYVRARLGSDSLRPPSSRDNRIAAAIEDWQGVRYVWGGQSRSGTDCSGFLLRMHQVAGVSIPRTTAQMRRTSQGGRIRADLRWGDTLVYPGHCAMYIGDGRTAETVGGSREGGVSHSSVWVRSSVVVRRFLP
jgi:hypothetical protein